MNGQSWGSELPPLRTSRCTERFKQGVGAVACNTDLGSLPAVPYNCLLPSPYERRREARRLILPPPLGHQSPSNRTSADRAKSMNTMNRATERSKFGRYRAELVFAQHRQEQPRVTTVSQAGFDEGNEPLLIVALEGRRMHLRRALLGRHC